MFLCTNCKSRLCPECREIEGEYEELLQNYKRANASLSAELETARQIIQSLERRAAMFESVAKLGYPEVIKKWMDAQVAVAAAVTR